MIALIRYKLDMLGMVTFHKSICEEMIFTIHVVSRNFQVALAIKVQLLGTSFIANQKVS